MREENSPGKKISKPIGNFETFLQEICDHNQRIVLDEPGQLDDPKKLFNSQKDEHVDYLKNQKMIDNYPLKFEHFIESKINDLDTLKSKISKETFDFLENNFKEEKVGITAAADNQDETLNYVIKSVDIMHFSKRNSQVFMIVKSVEEIIGESQSIGISVMRIYKENIEV